MEIQVYNSEKYDRGKNWYIIAGCVVILFIIISLVYNNLIGIVFTFIILGGYLFFTLLGEKIIKIKIRNEGLQIDDTIKPRNNIQGFVIELDKKGETVKNIVFVISNQNDIYTIYSTNNLAEFVKELIEDYGIPILGEINQTFMDKLIRKMKL